ncbi:MAG: acyltransferase [Betaproteobacteria bacterium]|nr:acyltransferase [Betaproteobacteria bacterium]
MSRTSPSPQPSPPLPGETEIRNPAAAKPATAGGRNPGLDWLRSAAILVVMANHGLIGFYISTGRVPFEGTLARVSSSAVLSIEWLFVLSGYLIGAMMIRSFDRGEGWTRAARDFWLRRWFRTFPNYYLFLAVNAVLAAAGIAHGEFAWSYAFFSQNLAWPERIPYFFGEAWSLALDEWFYLVMPILVGVLGYRRFGLKAAFVGATCLLIGLPTLARIAYPAAVEFFQWDAEVRRTTVLHLDATGFGVLAAVVNRWLPQWWGSHRKAKLAGGLALQLLGLVLVGGMVESGWADPAMRWLASAFAITAMGTGTFLAMPWLTQAHVRFAPLQWLVDRISLYSYSLYLVHFPLIFVFAHLFPVDAGTAPLRVAVTVAAWFACVLGLAGLTYHYFEKPVSDIRERFTRHVDASPFRVQQGS